MTFPTFHKEFEISTYELSGKNLASSNLDCNMIGRIRKHLTDGIEFHNPPSSETIKIANLEDQVPNYAGLMQLLQSKNNQLKIAN